MECVNRYGKAKKKLTIEQAESELGRLKKENKYESFGYYLCRYCGCYHIGRNK